MKTLSHQRWWARAATLMNAALAMSRWGQWLDTFGWEKLQAHERMTVAKWNSNCLIYWLINELITSPPLLCRVFFPRTLLAPIRHWANLTSRSILVLDIFYRGQVWKRPSELGLVQLKYNVTYKNDSLSCLCHHGRSRLWYSNISGLWKSHFDSLGMVSG